MTNTDDHSGTADRALYIDNAGNVIELILGVDKSVFQSTGPTGAPIFAISNIVDLQANANKVFFSNTIYGVITELALGAVDTFLQSTGVSSAPIFAKPRITRLLTNSNRVYFGNNASVVTEVVLGGAGSIFQSTGPTSAPIFKLPLLPTGYIDGLGLSFNTVAIVDIAAGEASDSTHVFNLVLSTPKTADITVTGAGGLQTGSTEAVDTWYKVLVIGTAFGPPEPTNVLLVPDGTAFSEVGFDVFRQVGWVRNDGSSNFIDFKMTGDGKHRTVMWINDTANRLVLSGGSAQTATAVDCSSLVPPTSELAHLKIEQDGIPAVDFSLTAIGPPIENIIKDQALAALICLDSSQQIFYNNAAPAGNVNINVRGYVDEIL